MKRFTFRAKTKDGAVVTGEVEAENPQACAKLIREKGLVPLDITEAGGPISFLISKLKDRISFDDVVTFTRQLSTMINAGLPLTQALDILRNQSKGPLAKLIGQVLADVEGGGSLSFALSKYPKVFSPTYIALIKSGEVGGVMDEVLARLSDNLEKEQEFRGKVKGALIYPIIIVLGMIIVSFIMMVFVVPRLLSLYTEFNADLPLPTKILIGVSNFATRLWPIILFAGVGAIYGVSLYRRTQEGKRRVDELILKIPIIGPLQREILLTDLTRTLSLMVGAGVSILEGLNITAEVSGNAVISDALKDTSKYVERGFPVAYAFARHPEAFPYLLSQMVAVGEETGKMDEVLRKVSHIFEVEADQKVKVLTTAVEPIVMVILGIGVGFLVIAVILPIYSLTSSF